MTPLALAVSRALIHFVWQGSIVGLSLWVVLYSLRNKSAGVRYTAGCVALVLLALLPLITTWALYTGSAGLIPVAASAPASDVSVLSSVQQAGVFAWLKWLQMWALPAWSLGVLLFSVRLGLGWKHAFELRRGGKPAGEGVVGTVDRLKKLMGVHRPVHVLLSVIADSPSVVGWVRPVILLPTATLMGLTPLQLEAILAHEIGHIKRYDYLVNMLQMLVETLLFYHPAVWWTSKRVRLERELCCDDLAVRFSGNALRYARALTTLEKLRLRTPVVVMASTGGPLLYRIQRLVGAAPKEYGASRLPGMFAVGLGILCIVLNVTWMRGQDAPGVKVDLGSSTVIHRSPVSYPEQPQKQGITGTVQVEVKLDSTGNVADARVLSGPEELRKAALESVLNWHFTSDAARSTRMVTISFSDQGKRVQVREAQKIEGAFGGVVGSEAMIAADLAKAEALKKAELEAVVRGAGTQKRQELERAIGELRRRQRDQSGTPDEQKAVELKLMALQKDLEATPFGARGVAGSNVMGRTLKGIATLGLSDTLRNDLISRLPIRQGDIISEQLWKQTDEAIHSYDEHMRVQFLTTDDGQAELRISAPGAR